MDHNKKVVELPLEDVLPNRFQPRIKFNEESIIELSESIKEHGVIQPIVVRPVGDKYEIIAGERRYKASTMAGLATIPAIVTNFNDKESAEVALIENVQRKDLTPIEEAISYKKILDMGYLTQDQLATKLGKTQSTVANKLRLLNLDEDVQEALLEDKISERHARSLLKLNDFSSQKKLLKKIIEERLTVRKTDEEINNMLNGNYKESSIELADLINQDLPKENTSFENLPFDFNAIGVTSESELPKEEILNIPKFEDLFVNAGVVEEKQEVQYNPEFIVPKFDNPTQIEESQNNEETTNSNVEEVLNPEFVVPKFDNPTQIEELQNNEETTKSNVEEVLNPEFVVPKFDNPTQIEESPNNEETTNNEDEEIFNPEFMVQKNDTQELNGADIDTQNANNDDYSSNPFDIIFDESNNNLDITPQEENNISTKADNILNECIPFVFENLFDIEEQKSESLAEKKYVDYVADENTSSQDSDSDIMPFNFSEINSFTNIEEPVKTESTSHNTYVANDIKAVVNTVHNCADTIRKYGFIVEVSEEEQPNEYKVTFVIKK